MISDVLFDVESCLDEAEKRISAYLEDDVMKRCYQDREILAEITDVLGRVRTLRVKLDNPLGFFDAREAAKSNP